jgi:pimeloyl-ACP methyl ester carboxylesterase
MEQPFDIATPLGPIRFWGRDTGKPLIVVLTGLGAEVWIYDRLQGDFPDADVLRTHLPGNHSPRLENASVGGFGAALAKALATGFPGRPATLVGISLGALVALACHASQKTAMVLVEPFLRTGGIPEFRAMFEAAGPGADGELFWSVLGVGADRTEDRDYTHLVDRIAVPVEVLFGDAGQTGPRLRSLVDERDRAAWATQPLANVTEVVGAGHNVAGYDAQAFLGAIRTVRRRAHGEAR